MTPISSVQTEAPAEATSASCATATAGCDLCRVGNWLSWLLQLAVAGILAQTLFFKFTAAPESVYIFRTLGMEPWGRYATGVAELVAVALLLRARTAALGAALTLGVIGGAITGHLTRLGIDVGGDGGLLFGLALSSFAGSVLILMIRRHQLLAFGRRVLAAVRASRGGRPVAADSRKSEPECPPLEATR